MRSIGLSVVYWTRMAEPGDVLLRNLVPHDRRFGSVATCIRAGTAAAAASRLVRGDSTIDALSRLQIARQPLSLNALVVDSTPRPVFQSAPTDRDRSDKLQIARAAIGRGAWTVLIVSPASRRPRRPVRRPTVGEIEACRCLITGRRARRLPGRSVIACDGGGGDATPERTLTRSMQQ